MASARLCRLRSSIEREGAAAVGSGRTVLTTGLFEVVVVVAVVDAHLPAIDFEDAVDEAAQEVAVMADEDHRTGEVLQGCQQRFPGLDVEVVRRFVEDQQVDRLYQHRRQNDPALFAAGEVVDPFVDIIPLKQKGGAEVAQRTEMGLRHGILDRVQDGLPGVEDIHGMLGEIPGIDVGPQIQTPGRRFRLARQHLQEGGFAGAIDADHGDLLLAPDRPRDAAEDRLFSPVGTGPDLAQGLDPGHIVAAARRLGKLEFDGPLLRRDLDPLDLGNLLDPGLDLGGMGSPGRETGDELLFLGEHLLLAAVAGQKLLAPDFPFPQVKVVVAAVGGDGAVRHLDDAGHDPVHEFPVMAGHQKGALERGGEPLLEPDDRFHIQMVRGFIQKEHVGIDRQDLGQGNAHLPAPAEGLHGVVILIRPDPQARQDDPAAAFQVVAAAVLELGLDVAVALQQIRHCLFHQGLAHGRFHFLNLSAEGHHRLGGGHDLLKGRAAGHGADILGKKAANDVARFRDFSGVELFLAHDQTKDTCFACAVGPDQAAAAAGQDLKTGIPKQDLRAILLADAVEMNHR